MRWLLTVVVTWVDEMHLEFFFKMFNNGRDIKRPVAVGFQDAYQLNSIDLKEMNNFSGSGHLAIDDQYEKP